MRGTGMRHAVRAIVLDPADRVLLGRHRWRFGAQRLAVWAAPGGGVQPGESPGAALVRELREEIGLAVGADLPHVWHQVAVGPEHIAGYDGVVNDYFLVRTAPFTPRGSFSDTELAAEALTGWRWWSLAEIAGHRGPEVFSPRDLAGPLAALLTGGVPAQPVPLGA